MNEDLRHPGRQVLEKCIAPLGLTVTEAAAGIGVTRNTLSRLIHGHHGISPDMAVRLSLAFGGTAETWLRLQTDYDLAQAREKVAVADIARFTSTLKLQRDVVRKVAMHEDGPDHDLRDTTPQQRIGMMWRLAQDAWAFKRESIAQSRLSRHTVHILRRGG